MITLYLMRTHQPFMSNTFLALDLRRNITNAKPSLLDPHLCLQGTSFVMILRPFCSLSLPCLSFAKVIWLTPKSSPPPAWSTNNWASQVSNLDWTQTLIPFLLVILCHHWLLLFGSKTMHNNNCNKRNILNWWYAQYCNKTKHINLMTSQTHLRRTKKIKIQFRS